MAQRDALSAVRQRDHFDFLLCRVAKPAYMAWSGVAFMCLRAAEINNRAIAV
jgi:hypothetical protein